MALITFSVLGMANLASAQQATPNVEPHNEAGASPAGPAMTANGQSNSEGSIKSYPYDQNAVCIMVELMVDIGLPHLSEARLRDQKHFVKTSTIRTQEGVAVDTYHFESGDIKGVVVHSKFDAFFITAQFGRKAIPKSIRSRAHLLSLLSIADPPERDETLSLECGNILVSLRLEAQQIGSIKFTRVNYD